MSGNSRNAKTIWPTAMMVIAIEIKIKNQNVQKSRLKTYSSLKQLLSIFNSFLVKFFTYLYLMIFSSVLYMIWKNLIARNRNDFQYSRALQTKVYRPKSVQQYTSFNPTLVHTLSWLSGHKLKFRMRRWEFESEKKHEFGSRNMAPNTRKVKSLSRPKRLWR